MAHKEPIEPPIDPEEERAQEHVKQIMEKDEPKNEVQPVLPDEQTGESVVATSEPPTAPDVPVDSPEVAQDDELAEIKKAAEAALLASEAKQAAQASAPIPAESTTAPEVESDVEEGFVVGQAAEPTPEETKAAATKEVAEDLGVSKAVDDITRAEADAALPKEDDSLEAPVVMKISIFGRMKNAIYAWWDNPKKRYGTLIVLAVVLAIILGVPSIRANALNLIGVRSSIIVTTIDGTTNLPLENVVVSAMGAEGKTNADGAIKLTGVKLGGQDVVIAKAGFATVKKHVNLGMRVQDLGEITMKAVGTQYVLSVTDYISGKPAANVSVESGEATTKSDKTGKAILTVPPVDSGNLEITVGGTDYRKDKIAAPQDPATVIAVKVVPAAPDVYVSKESGKYDVYRIDVDGKNKKVLLPGTGLETPNSSLSVSDDSTHTAVVTSRDNKRNKDGFLLSTLTIVNTDDGSYEAVDHSEQFILLGWDGNSLIYQQTIAGASASDPSRQKIFSYDVTSGKRYQLANANYFGSALLFGDKLYYVVSSTDPTAEGNFSSVDLTGSNRKTIMKGNIWSFIRADYDLIRLQKSDNTWYEYKLGDSSTKPSVAPSSYSSRMYVDSVDGKTSLWVDMRDTSGVVMKRAVAEGTEKELFTQKHAQSIVRWLNPTSFIFRVTSANESADYAASVDGGKQILVHEVSATQGY